MNTILFRSFILGGSFFVGISTSIAAGLDPANMISASTMETSCLGANVSHHMYLPNGTTNLTIQPSDNFRWSVGDANNLAQIIEGSSKISIWSQTASSSCSTGWYRASWVIPGDGQWYAALFRPTDMSACTISKPTTINPSQPVVQFVYKVAYKPQTGLQSGTSGYYYFLPSSTITNLSPSSTPNNTKRTWGPEAVHNNECQNYYLSYCGDGVVDTQAFDNGVSGGEQCDLGTQNGQAGSACSATCQTVTVNPPNPVCSTTVTGLQSSPLTTGACNAGSVYGFQANTVGNTTNYTWSCYNPTVCPLPGTTVPSPQPEYCIPASCSASYTNAVACIPGTTTGVQSAPLTATSPNLCPAGQTVGGFTPTTVGTLTTYAWSCNGSAVGGACSASYNSNPASCVPGTTVGAQIIPLTSLSPNLCPTGVVVGGFAENRTGSLRTYNWSCGGSPVGGACAAMYDSSAATAFNLSVKKYIGTNDAQTSATAVSTSTNSPLSYQIVVKNEGTGTTSGITTMQDILPTGVAFNGSASWTNGNWNCTYIAATRLTRCNNSVDQVGSGANLGATILIPVTVTATSGQVVANITAIDNPNETTRCNLLGTFPADASSYCTLDTLNSDPAYFSVGGNPPGGVAIVGSCPGGVPTCGNYKSIVECQNAGAKNCRDADAVGQNACNAEAALGCPGGPTCTVNCGGGGGYCGNGILEPNLDEECDVAGGASWCVNCKVACLNSSVGNCTNPGANGIDDMWMTIPRLSNARLGYTWLDGIPGKIRFNANGMVFGLGTKAFTLADTVGYGIKTDLQIPIVIPVDKDMCLTSGGTVLNSESVCTTFGEAAKRGTPITTIDSQTVEYGKNVVWTRPLDGKEFVIIGGGSIYYQTSLKGLYYSQYISSSNNIEFFKGAREYRKIGGGSTKLSDAFFGKAAGNDGSFTLQSESFDINTGLPSGYVNLVSLPVRVSSALLGTTSTPVNRSIENFISKTSLYDFLSSIRSPSSLSSTTTIRNDASSNANINLNITTTGNKTVANMAQLEAYKFNGNKNIIAIKGDLTIEDYGRNCTFVMDGVRTVIVEGNLIIKCNTVYGSSDTTSSFAWIVKGGNILIDSGIATDPQSGVSKISGIYIAIGANTTADCTTTGHLCSIANTPSQKILRVEGSLYGNAKPLLDSRLYARGTSAYEILTTGTILTYSNRALVNPPPLLSEYLSNYNVERVVK